MLNINENCHFFLGLISFRIGSTPTPDPFIAVGTFAPPSGDVSSGYTFAFDKSGNGQIFPVKGYRLGGLGGPTTGVPIDIAPATNVNMNGITFSPGAIPVTVANTAYILDKVIVPHSTCYCQGG